jgi:hypothetical protein
MAALATGLSTLATMGSTTGAKNTAPAPIAMVVHVPPNRKPFLKRAILHLLFLFTANH